MASPDPLLAQIAARFANLDVEKARGGYTLVERRGGHRVARLKPIADSDRFELFYWSVVRDGWRTFGDFGRLKLTLDRAHEIFTTETVFRLHRRR
jgi:tRNA isopentenyl-2-thiomethyl-A-37 hydroxylase MiaE